MSRAPVRLAVVNDFEIVVVGIAKMVANEPRVDMVLADMFAAVPGDGIDLEELISAGGPQVVVYTWNTHRAAVARALALGASGYLSKGLGALQIAEALSLSIKTYIRSAYAKTGVTRRSQAVGWALRHGFAPEAGRETPDTSHRPRGGTGLG